MQSLDVTYKSLKELVLQMKATGLPGFDVLKCQPNSPLGVPGDRVHFKITGTKIVVPPPWSQDISIPEELWYNDGMKFSINLNGEGTDDVSEPWIDIFPREEQYIVIEPVIFYRLTVRNSDDQGGQPYPVQLHIYQDPQFIEQINRMLERQPR